MTFIDFFAGTGGFRRGMELAGHKCLGFCEYDKFAVQSYRAMHDTEGEWYAKDIREVRAADVPRADVWCAGFPCQDVSIAGKCLGFKGKRSSLFFAVTGLVRDLGEKDRPSYLLFENVKNLLSVNGGFDFARILVELDEIGYDVEWQLINSAEVVPQNRERVFIVGRIRSKHGRKVFPVGESVEIHNRPETAGKIHGDKVMTLTAKGQSNWTGTFIKQICNVSPTKTRSNPNQGRVYDTSGIAPCLNCMGGGGLEPKIAIPISMTQKKIKPCELAPTLTAAGPSRGRGNSSPVGGVMIKTAIPCITPDRINKRQNGRRFKNNNDPMFTLTAQDRHGVIIYSGEKYFIRKLTPLECWRLQGWEDEYFFRAFFLDKDLAHKFNNAYQRHKSNPVRLMRWAFGHQKMSDSQLYKQAGNGVTVTVIRRIAEKFRSEE
ncbi:MAG: DNA (cytosine-5-)-methyltransferase [Ruminococcus sp.]|nr:DNA (cytosine-5-)-methyltransferase [Ruminococcus sp.]